MSTTVLLDTSTTANTASSSSFNVTLNTNGANRTAVLFIASKDSTTVSSVSGGCTWSKQPVTNAVTGREIWTGVLTSSQSGTTVTVNLSGTSNFAGAILDTYYTSGSVVAPSIDAANATTYTTNGAPSGSVTTGVNNTTVASYIYGGAVGAPFAGTGYSQTSETNLGVGSGRYVEGELSTSDTTLAGTTVSPGFTQSSANSGDIITISFYKPGLIAVTGSVTQDSLTTHASSLTTSTQSWAVGDLVVAFVHMTANSSNSATHVSSITNTGTGLGTWALLSDGTNNAKSTLALDPESSEVWCAVASSSGSGTITVNFQSACSQTYTSVLTFRLVNVNTNSHKGCNAVGLANSFFTTVSYPSVTSTVPNTQCIEFYDQTGPLSSPTVGTGYSLVSLYNVSSGAVEMLVGLQNSTDVLSGTNVTPAGSPGGDGSQETFAFSALLVQGSGGGAAPPPTVVFSSTLMMMGV